MRRIITALLLLASMNASGAGDVYYCADTASSGFIWKNGGYKRTSFKSAKFKMQHEGMQVQLKGFGNSTDGTFVCESFWNRTQSQKLKCHKNADLFNYNAKTGRYVRGTLYGWLDDDPSTGMDTMDLTYGTGEKFD